MTSSDTRPLPNGPLGSEARARVEALWLAFFLAILAARVRTSVPPNVGISRPLSASEAGRLHAVLGRHMSRKLDGCRLYRRANDWRQDLHPILGFRQNLIYGVLPRKGVVVHHINENPCLFEP